MSIHVWTCLQQPSPPQKANIKTTTQFLIPNNGKLLVCLFWCFPRIIWVLLRHSSWMLLLNLPMLQFRLKYGGKHGKPTQKRMGSLWKSPWLQGSEACPVSGEASLPDDLPRSPQGEGQLHVTSLQCEKGVLPYQKRHPKSTWDGAGRCCAKSLLNEIRIDNCSG